MDLMPGNLSRIIFDCFDLPLPVFRGSKEPIRKQLSLQLRRRCTYINHLFQRMLLLYGVWSAYGSLIVCSACMYGRRRVLHLLLYCTYISPFLSPFLFYSWVRLFILDSMAVCVCCVYVWLWCSFSLDRRGDGGSMAGQQSRRRGAGAILQLPTCWRIGRSHHRSGRKLPTAIS